MPTAAPNNPTTTPINTAPTANHTGKVITNMIAINTLVEEDMLRVAMA